MIDHKSNYQQRECTACACSKDQTNTPRAVHRGQWCAINTIEHANVLSSVTVAISVYTYSPVGREQVVGYAVVLVEQALPSRGACRSARLLLRPNCRALSLPPTSVHGSASPKLLIRVAPVCPQLRGRQLNTSIPGC